MPKIIIASGPVIIENRKVLLNISSGDEFWKFCGGKIREGERLAQTAIRRAKEELGINIEVANHEPFFMHTTKMIEGEEADVILVHWLAKRKGDIQPGEMVKEWKWWEVDNLPENIGPNILPAMRHFGFIK